MKRIISLLLACLLICAPALAETVGTTGPQQSGSTWDSAVMPGIPVITLIEYDGRFYCMEIPAEGLPSDACESCTLEVGSRNPAMDHWDEYAITAHQYREYYTATCTVCHRTADVFLLGDTAPHTWEVVAAFHHYGTVHTIISVCRTCSTVITDAVFCPGANGGGCTEPILP